MCRTIDLIIGPAAALSVAPTDCDDGGAACRDLSRPFLALGPVVSDRDLGGSHVVAIQCDVKDPDALNLAAEACGLVAVATPEFGWWGSWLDDYNADDAAYRNGISAKDYGKCAWALAQADSPLGKAELAARAAGRRLTPQEAEAIRVREYGKAWRTHHQKPYDVGVVPNPAGGYRLVYDYVGGGRSLVAKIGKGAERLRQHYAVEAAVAVATRQGHKVLSRETLEGGRIRVLLDATPHAAAKVTLG